VEKIDKSQDSALLALRAAQVQRGGARAAVLGVNDGLVSTLCIVLGVAGATGDAKAVLVAGLAGLIAGAISMAAGEWISVASQVDLFKGILNDLKRLVKTDKELLVEQLGQNFKDSGITDKTAQAAAKEVSRDDKHLYNGYALNIIGINPSELGSPWTAAISSLLLFTAGALVALAPWFFLEDTPAIVWSIVLTAIGGIIVGAYVAKTSGLNVPKGALRQLLIIIFASAVTYGIGVLFGTTVV
jgi:VIT1/CCC1 family predicted Fe2+/Mn2+ transporter